LPLQLQNVAVVAEHVIIAGWSQLPGASHPALVKKHC
jgi:hypothetical protein